MRGIIINTLIGLVIGTVLTGGFLFFKQTFLATSSISGSVNFTALKPAASDQGAILIKYRKYKDTGDYKDTGVRALLANGSKWIWSKAETGQPYEIIAELIIDGRSIKTSEPIVVTAPAKDQILELRLTWQDLPGDNASMQNNIISGTVKVNGYIPSGSTIVISARKANEANYQIVQTVNNASSMQKWIWEKSIPMQQYAMKATLMINNIPQGQSEIESAQGSDTAINLIINSLAIVPTVTPSSISQSVSTSSPIIINTKTNSTGSISGNVYINGPINSNTSLLVMWRYPGQGIYNIITRINNPRHDGQAWSWTGSTAGKQYEIIAVLQVNDNNIATSRSTVIAAPATDLNILVNSGVVVSTPTNLPYKKDICVGIGSNKYNLTVGIPYNPQAGNYWLQVGSTSGASDIYNGKFKPQNDNTQDQYQTVIVDQSKTYYAEYAYSLCSNCENSANFSAFSNAAQVGCF